MKQGYRLATFLLVTRRIDWGPSKQLPAGMDPTTS